MTAQEDPEERSAQMRLVRSTDTKPEVTVRKMLFRAGFRYRLHARSLPGCPDIVFPRWKKAIFVHGCFWHRHTGCRLARLPKSRLSYWEPKLEGNAVRDQGNLDELRRCGWDVLVVWECEVRRGEGLEARLFEFLADTGVSRGRAANSTVASPPQ